MQPLPASQLGSSDGPSFPCAYAKSPAERAICRQPMLAALDRQLAHAYQSAKAASAEEGAATLSTQQQAWLLRRDACGGNELCLQHTMSERLVELKHGGR